jgi:hypothetical protein
MGLYVFLKGEVLAGTSATCPSLFGAPLSAIITVFLANKEQESITIPHHVRLVVELVRNEDLPAIDVLPVLPGTMPVVSDEEWGVANDLL